MTKQLDEARARLAALEAAQAAWNAHVAERDAAIAPNLAKHKAIADRQRKTILLTKAGGMPYSDAGPIRRMTLGNVTEGWSRAFRGLKPAVVVAKLLGGKANNGEKADGISVGAGNTYSLRGFLDRTRLVTREQLRPVDRAVAARIRAEKRLAAAWAAEREAYAAAYEVGAKLDVLEVARSLAKRFSLVIEAQYDHELQPRGIERDLEDARQHLAWVKAKNPDKGVCPCYECVSDRRTAEANKQELARRAELPRKKLPCEKHGTKIMAVEVRNQRVPEGFTVAELGDNQLTAGVHELPVGYCPGGEVILDVKELLRLREVAARAEARRPSFAFTCPSDECGEQVESKIEQRTERVWRGGEGYRDEAYEVVVCPACELEFNVAGVKLARVKKAA